MAAPAAATAETEPPLRRDTLLTPVDDAGLVLKKLMQGNERYANGNTIAPDRHADARDTTAASQRPIAIILSCADSRVAPEILFDQGIGDLFVVRVAGNTLTPDGQASMEYAVAVLGTPLLFVLGHEGCGAVDAALKAYEQGATFPGEIDDLVDLIEPAIAIASAEQSPVPLSEAVEENVDYVVEKTEIAGTVLSRAVAEGKLKIVGGVYDLDSGKVTIVEGIEYDEDTT